MPGPVLTALAAKALTEHVVIPAVKAGANAISQVVSAGLQQFRTTGPSVRCTPMLSMVYGMNKSRVSRNDLGGKDTVFGNLLPNKQVAEAQLKQRPDPRLKPEPMPTPAASLRNDPPFKVQPLRPH
jgi:hypothetical protein